MHLLVAFSVAAGLAVGGAPGPADNVTIPVDSATIPADKAPVPIPRVTAPVSPEADFQWQVQELQDGAELITLIGRIDHIVPSGEGRKLAHSKARAENDPVPLLAVLRDTLGDKDPKNDRLLTIWLFTDPRPSNGRRILSAVPFYYRRDDDRKAPATARLTKLSDLTQPESHVASSVGHNLVQWLVLDGISTPVRASSRTYRTNEVDARRLYLEEGITFLRRARDSGAVSPLSHAEMDSLIGRLHLSKQAFGGLTRDRRLEEVVEHEELTRKIAEGQNWEILRQAAEKTGLIFEPIQVAGISGEFALLWMDADVPGSAHLPAPESPATASIFKLLTISNPSSSRALKHWNGYQEVRSFTADGALLPLGETGSYEHRLIPLSLYSLDYSRVPLLLIDFQDPTRAKRREISQRAWNDIVHGVLGLSMTANWYYFAGSAVYDYIQSRRGSALDQGSRLDCYARFRAALMLDHDLDGDFRSYMRERLSRMATNPLEVSPDWELEVAGLNFQQLNSNLAKSSFTDGLDNKRRAEMAEATETSARRVTADIEHAVTLGAYTKRTPKNKFNLIDLDHERRIQADLTVLEKATRDSIDPDVGSDSKAVANSLAELTELVDANTPPADQKRARIVIAKLKVSSNGELLAQSARLEESLVSIRGGKRTEELTTITKKPDTSGSPTLE
ncbi:MAG: hypothetical protein WBW33_19545 [Bryobacteraceae bacterium]